MLSSFCFSVLIGTVLGVLSGLGVGGGSLLLLWLTMAAGIDPMTARGINLLFFLPAAIISCCFRWKQGSLSLAPILPALIAGSFSAAVFSWVGLQLELGLLNKGFGILLLATGIRELLYRPKS